MSVSNEIKLNENWVDDDDDDVMSEMLMLMI